MFFRTAGIGIRGNLLRRGDVIRVYRENRGMTQAELGRLGTARRGVNAATAEAIADVLGISAGRTLEPEGEWWKS